MPLVSPMDGQPGLLGHFDSPHAALHAAQIERVTLVSPDVAGNAGAGGSASPRALSRR
jgi:hypothetical protein